MLASGIVIGAVPVLDTVVQLVSYPYLDPGSTDESRTPAM